MEVVTRVPFILVETVESGRPCFGPRDSSSPAEAIPPLKPFRNVLLEILMA
jgi:hypothetical protein